MLEKKDEEEEEEEEERDTEVFNYFIGIEV